jgi:hypothetical protein
MLGDAVDLDFDFSGDFLLGSDGDLADTADDYLRSLVNQIRDLVKSEQSNWESDPQFAADLFEFIGEPNTRAIGKKIEDRLRLRITGIGLVPERDLKIKAVPVHIHQIAVFIKISATATPDNKLTQGEPIVLTFVYDTMEQGIFFQLPNTNVSEPF